MAETPTVLSAQAAYYRAEAEEIDLRARFFPETEELHHAMLRRRDAALALAAALESLELPSSREWKKKR